MKTLFDTGAIKSLMSGKMWRDLKLGPLDDRNLPSVVRANGSSLGVLGRIRCTIAFEKDEDKFDQTFLVCENLQRGVILGKDFTRQNCAGVYWTPHNTRVLHTNLKTIAETKELLPSGTAAIHVKQTTKLPPRSLAVVDVNINTASVDKIRMVPDKLCQYLGHLLSEEGIQPLPEKLESIAKIPRPKNQKEVKQFLGLIGYYRKFVPRFTDISRVLNKLTCKDEEFKWTPECDKCFNMLKYYLQEAPILRYPDPEARYVLYTDASKYAYAGVLTQTVDGTDHLIAYVSGLFRGSQLNWAALTKEVYAIYMSVKKLSFYLDSARITVRSDHPPLKKFLEKNTMNVKVNNWAVELESQKIDFVFIPGIKNVLADTLSRLIKVDNDVKLPEEQEGEEFGYIPFEKLPRTQVETSEEVWINEVTQDKVTIKLQDPIQ